MRIETFLLKIFYTVGLITIATVLLTITTNLINEHDDLISLLGLISSLAVILLLVYSAIKIWLKNKTKTQNEQSN